MSKKPIIEDFAKLEKLIADAQCRIYKFTSILNIMDSMLEKERESLKELYENFIKEKQ